MPHYFIGISYIIYMTKEVFSDTLLDLGPKVSFFSPQIVHCIHISYWTAAAPALASAAALLAAIVSSLATLSNLAHPI